VPRGTENPSAFFDSLVGTEVDFYGVCDGFFKIGRGGDAWTFEAVQDEDDGYRSLLECVRLGGNAHNLTFFASPLERCRLEVAGQPSDFEGYQLVGVDSGNVWLLVGTSRNDELYPCFIFEYTPPARALGFHNRNGVARQSPLERVEPNPVQAPPKPSNQKLNVLPWEEV
jgi:hypothetical protein